MNTQTNLALTAPPLAQSSLSVWPRLPALGDLNAYITAVHAMPMLSLEQEREYAQNYRQNEDVQAAGYLVLSHLRVVLSMARQYAGYGLPQADLIQEGNVGLMKAVKRFDPDQGVRLVSYAMHWIKAEMHDYILKNWRIVKVATTKAQRKLFFNLRSMKNSLQEQDEDTIHYGALTSAQVASMAKKLDVKPEEVREMELRMGGHDILIDPAPDENGDDFGPLHYLSDAAHQPETILEAQQSDRRSHQGVREALAQLDERSRDIVEQRWLAVDENGGGATLHQLAAKYKISAERVRQIEVAAMKKMRAVLA